MRIALLSPIWERVPPPAYGGIEAIVGLLADGLVARGHDVTLFATGDSVTRARLAFTEARPLREARLPGHHANPRELAHVLACFRQAADFDVIHNHVGYLAMAMAGCVTTPVVTTLHGPFTAHNMGVYQACEAQPYVSISLAQRVLGPRGLHYAGNVYNGIDTAGYQLGPKRGYVLHLGRMCAEKGTHIAIAAARAAGVPLILAGKIDAVDDGYYAEHVAPALDGEQVRYIGEVGGEAKVRLMAGAIAFLHPVQWPEPFGLVMVEAMASGTPVIAFPHGSIPEVVASGQSGFVVNDVAEMAAAIGRAADLEPAACRAYAVAHFDQRRMLDGYEAVFDALVGARSAA